MHLRRIPRDLEDDLFPDGRGGPGTTKETKKNHYSIFVSVGFIFFSNKGGRGRGSYGAPRDDYGGRYLFLCLKLLAWFFFNFSFFSRFC